LSLILLLNKKNHVSIITVTWGYVEQQWFYWAPINF